MASYSDDDDTESITSVARPLLEDLLKPSDKRALHELKTKLEDAIINNDLFGPVLRRHRRKRSLVDGWAPASVVEEEKEEVDEDEEGEKEKAHHDMKNVSLWGIPLLPSKGHEGTDIILLKFLLACEFKANAALKKLKRTLRWRRDLAVDGILDEHLDAPEVKRAACMDGRGKEGQPLCYDSYGLFCRDKELYKKTFGDEERCEKFLRWRVQFMEEGIMKQLSLKPGGVGQMVQIVDLKGSYRPSMKELGRAMKKVFSVLQDNYPEFIAKTILINVSFRYYVYHSLFSQFVPPNMRRKIIFARPSKVTETLLKFAAIEDLPVKYGGLKRDEDDEFPPENKGKVLGLVLKGSATVFIEIPVTQAGVTAVWDLTVVGLDASYKEEFIPEDQGSYTILIQEEKKLHQTVRSSFYISEPGRVVLTITNRSYKKKKMVFYRSKSKPTVPLYHNLLRQGTTSKA